MVMWLVCRLFRLVNNMTLHVEFDDHSIKNLDVVAVFLVVSSDTLCYIASGDDGACQTISLEDVLYFRVRP